MLALNAVEIAVEDAGVAGVAEEDQCVGEWLEEWLDGGFERLVGLGIVIHYQCLDHQRLTYGGRNEDIPQR